MKSLSLAILLLCASTSYASSWLPHNITLEQFKETDIYVTGKSIHGSSHRDNLNEENWGLGLGASTGYQNDHNQKVYALYFRDSFKEPQTMVGYANMKNVYGNRTVSVGYAAGLMHKPSQLSMIVPYVMPLVQLEYHKTSLMITGLPKLPKVQDRQLGDILFFFVQRSF